MNSDNTVSHDLVKDTKRYSCQECDYKSFWSFNLNAHVKNVHSKSKPNRCDLCNYKTPLADGLKKHAEEVHLAGKSQFHCRFCDFAASSVRVTAKHVKMNHKREKPYACPHCPHRTRRLVYLKTHVVGKHLKERPHGCPECRCKFAHLSSLKEHISALHSEVHPCHCGYYARSIEEKNSHTLTDHSYEFSQELTYLALKTLKSFKPLF